MINEYTLFDDGDDQSMNYEYEFKKDKHVRFVTPEEVTPSLNTECCIYGDFAVGNENGNYKKVMEMINSRNWHLNCLFVNALNKFREPYDDVKYDYRLFIIGDITAGIIEKVGFEQYALEDEYIKVAISLQKKRHFLFIKESDFLLLGKCNIPFNKCPKIDAGSELVFSPCGTWYVGDEGCFSYIFNCGLRVTEYAEKADVLVVPNDYYQSVVEHGHYSDYECALHKAFYYALNHGKNKQLIILESDFTASTEELRKQGRIVQENSLSCSGKTFMVSLLGKDKTKAIDYICANGGTVVESKLKHVGEIDVLLYKSDNFYLNERMSAALERVNRGENVLILTMEEFEKAVGIKANQFKETSKAEKNPFNVEDMKKIWNYETVEGGVRIKYCKKRMIDVVIPERIGKLPVVCIGKRNQLFDFLNSSNISDHILFSTPIGENVFGYSSQIMKSVTIPSSVRIIEDEAFSSLSTLESIIIPQSVEKIGNKAFNFCSKLKELIIPSSVTEIGLRAVSFCNDLQTLIVDENNPVYYSKGNCIIERASKTIVAGCGRSVIPDGIFHIGKHAFHGCAGLTNIIIPNGVTSIEDYAFFYCDSLSSITIPESIEKIGVRAFESCDSLNEIHIASLFNWCKIDFDSSKYITGNPLCYAKNLYINGQLATDLVIPDGVESIGRRTFAGFNSLTSVTIPESVTQIGDAAFIRCSNLTSIKIPKSVTSIGPRAFDSCENLSDISLPDSITDIPDYAFSRCNNLKSIKIPESIIIISNKAFYNTKLESVFLPLHLKGKLDEYMFGYYAKLIYY